MKTLVNTQQELSSLLMSNGDTIRRFGAQRLGLFRSYASTRRNGPQKDLGMLVEFANGEKNYSNYVHLICFLEDLLNSEVELITPDSLSPYIRSSVLAEVEQYLSFEA